MVDGVFLPLNRNQVTSPGDFSNLLLLNTIPSMIEEKEISELRKYSTEMNNKKDDIRLLWDVVRSIERVLDDLINT